MQMANEVRSVERRQDFEDGKPVDGIVEVEKAATPIFKPMRRKLYVPSEEDD